MQPSNFPRPIEPEDLFHLKFIQDAKTRWICTQPVLTARMNAA